MENAQEARRTLVPQDTARLSFWLTINKAIETHGV